MTALVNSLQSFELCSNAVSLRTECRFRVRTKREVVLISAYCTITIAQLRRKPPFFSQQRR